MSNVVKYTTGSTNLVDTLSFLHHMSSNTQPQLLSQSLIVLWLVSVDLCKLNICNKINKLSKQMRIIKLRTNFEGQVHSLLV